MASQNLIIKVCKLFYQEGLTKTQIEKRLHISRFKVARLLKQAQDMGLVKIEILEPRDDLSDIEAALENATGLKNVILVRDIGETPQLLKEKAGRAAADYLLEIIGDKSVLGIGWGTTTYELVRALPENINKKVTVVQVSGGSTKMDSGVDSQGLTVQLAKKFGCSPLLMHAPAIVDRPETRKMLMEESTLKDVFKAYKKMNVLIAGIGALLPKKFLGSWVNDARVMKTLRRQGAVTEYLSYFFDGQGRPCSTENRDRTIAIPLEDIKKMPCSIGLAVGGEKAEAVLGVVRSGYINTLITDTTTAKTIEQIIETTN